MNVGEVVRIERHYCGRCERETDVEMRSTVSVTNLDGQVTRRTRYSVMCLNCFAWTTFVVPSRLEYQAASA